MCTASELYASGFEKHIQHILYPLCVSLGQQLKACLANTSTMLEENWIQLIIQLLEQHIW